MNAPDVAGFRLRIECTHAEGRNARLGTLKALAADGVWTHVDVTGPHLTAGPSTAWPWRFLAVDCPICGAHPKLSRAKVEQLLDAYAPAERKAEATAALPFRAL